VQLRHEVDDLVMAQEEGLRAAATGVAQRLRDAGRRVDLVLEPKRLKWAFKQAERCNAGGWQGAGGRAAAVHRRRETLGPAGQALARQRSPVGLQLSAVGAGWEPTCWSRPTCAGTWRPPALCAARLVLVAPDEWARGVVRVKELASREERDVPLEEL
jgi:histidyl-tRNA synthetase